jgi:hypothetical protein
MQVDNIYHQIHLRKSGRFIYVAQVGVSSLKPGTDMTGGQTTAGRDMRIVELSAPGSVDELWRECELRDENETVLKQGIDGIREAVRRQNEAAATRERMILDESGRHLAEIDREIARLRSAIDNRDQRVRDEVRRTTNRSCEMSAEKCLEWAVDVIEAELHQLQREKLDVKAEEVVTQRSVLRPETGDPALDVANTVRGVVDQIDKSYGKVEQFLEITEVVNYRLDGYGTSGKRDVYREADSVWVYLSPQDDETFQVLVAVAFAVGHSSLGQHGATRHRRTGSAREQRVSRRESASRGRRTFGDTASLEAPEVLSDDRLDILGSSTLHDPDEAKRSRSASENDGESGGKTIRRVGPRIPKKSGNMTLGVGFSMSAVSHRRNSDPEPIYAFANEQADTITMLPYADGYALPTMPRGVTLMLGITLRQQPWVGFEGIVDLLFANRFSAFFFDFDVDFAIPVLRGRLWIPIGMGVTLGSLWFEYGEYGQALESMYRKCDLSETSTDGELSDFQFGLHAVSGLALRLGGPFDLFVEGGYRYHFTHGNWELEYETGYRDSDGDKETEDLSIPESHLPFTDMHVRGVMVRAGIALTL